MKKDLRGVGGWLGFLVILLMVLTPLMSLGRMYSEIRQVEEALGGQTNAEWEMLKTIFWSLFFVQMAILFVSGYLLNNVFKPSSVRLAIAGLWLAGPVLGLVNILVAASVASIGSVAQEAAGPLFGSLFWASIWTAYLCFSKRVRNTYYQTGPEVQSSEPLDRTAMLARLEAMAIDPALTPAERENAASRLPALRELEAGKT